MKYFFPALMGLVILFGLGLTATPFVAEWFFPAAQTSFQQSKPEDARKAIAGWFGVAPGQVADAKAIRQRSVHGNTAWFRFSMGRGPVEQFVRQSQLKQLELTPEVMQGVFMALVPPVDWWQPASLARQSWFSGKAEGQELGLVYDAETQRGFLLVRTVVKANTGF